VAIGFNDPKPVHPSALCAIDISKAFNTVNHTILLVQISASSLNSNLVRWLAAYLRGRFAHCVWNSATSTPRIIYSGVSQGSCLSPVLSNFFVSYCPTLADSYADDFNILSRMQI
jgi:retron-type reverse transcriptase